MIKPIRPHFTPELDPGFLPAVLWNRAYRESLASCLDPQPVILALEQGDGSITRYEFHVFPEGHSEAPENFRYVERILKFMLWSRGGFRIHMSAPALLVDKINRHIVESRTGQFDADLMGTRIYGKPFELVNTPANEVPKERQTHRPLGRHLKGCRIGFDLGGSDRKCAAVIDGNVVFSQEITWCPYFEPDPTYHIEGIEDSLRRAAANLPHVDSIGGSAAGVYVNNEVRVASLFRGVAKDDFERKVRRIFFDIQQKWNGVPFEVVNDGEVTALAGSIALNDNAVLGISMGTSLAAGYVNEDGNITSWLNELAFAPVDYQANGPIDEWSGDAGCGVQYLSQQAVARLAPLAGIELPLEMVPSKQLLEVQKLMEKDDSRARSIYQTIGTYLGYTLAHYADFYAIRNVLLLGRVTSGPGGELILNHARTILAEEFPSTAEKVRLHTTNEKDKRHGQAVAAASLPVISRA